MKILLLNPQIDASHEVSRSLVSKGVALLTARDADEASQMLQLHGASIDLAIVHREGARGNGEPGFEFIKRLKADPQQADLPILITSSKWSEADCAHHQQSPDGANAYLSGAFDGAKLVQTVEAIFQQPLQAVDAPRETFDPIAAPATMDLSDSSVAESAPAPADGLELPPPLGGLELPGPDVGLGLGAAPQFPPAPPSLLAPGGLPPRGDAEAVTGAGPAVSSDLVLEDASRLFVQPELSEQADPSAMIVLEAPDSPAADESLSTHFVDAPGEISPFPQFENAPEGDAPAAADDPQVAQEMPYLFTGKGGSSALAGMNPAMTFAQPIGDAVVPGGAAQAPDLETLKKYLLLREQDVAVLSTQLKNMQDQLGVQDGQLREERARNVELMHTSKEQRRKIEEYEAGRNMADEDLQKEAEDLRFQLKAKNDKARILEMQVRDATEEMDRLKERVRSDIRKIRVRERELENRLEIVKKDSEALIAARENKIIELKRKLDLLEFNMDLLQNQFTKEKDTTGKLREKLAKAAQVVRVAGGILGPQGVPSGGSRTGDLGSSRGSGLANSLGTGADDSDNELTDAQTAADLTAGAGVGSSPEDGTIVLGDSGGAGFQFEVDEDAKTKLVAS